MARAVIVCVMGQTTTIESVPDDRMAQALRFLAGGRRSDIRVAVRADTFEQMIEQSARPCRLWWARRGGQPVAAVLVVPSAGRVGMLFHSPPQAPGVEVRAVSGVVARAAGQALQDDLAFVQALLPTSRRADSRMLLDAGLQKLAELVYMRRDLSKPVPEPDPPRVTWRNYRKEGDEQFAAAIAGTYEQSLDCPGLRGLRRLSDVIAGHKASGIFNPKSWWIARVADRPAGCILVNESAVSPGDAELVYMGLLAGFRGRGLGGAMVRHAARWARRRGRRFLQVAVDSENAYAKRVYDREGFRETSRRIAYILPPHTAKPLAE